jgi:hypothetical protein
LKATEKEWQAYEDNIRGYNNKKADRTAKIDGLFNAKDEAVVKARDEILQRSFENKYASPDEKEKDAARLATMVGGDRQIADALMAQVGQQGEVARAKQAADRLLADKSEVKTMVTDTNPGQRQKDAPPPAITAAGAQEEKKSQR